MRKDSPKISSERAANSTVPRPALHSPALSFTIRPVAPFCLDLTVWALRRRPENILDRWDSHVYRRALCFDSTIAHQPIEISVEQAGSALRPSLRVSARVTHPSRELQRTIRNTLESMLGLNLDLRVFYSFAAKQKRLAPLISSLTGLKPPRYPTIFEALVNAISCQQVSLNVGIMLLNRLVQNFGLPAATNPSAHCFPRPQDLTAIPSGSLRALGYSTNKERAILDLSRSIVSGEVNLESIRELDDPPALERLTSIRGIGRWSAEYALLRGMGRLNIFPGDDVGGWNNLQKHLRLRSRPDYAKTRKLLAPWKDYAGLIYFHFLLDNLRSRGLLT